jgi:hypothetical protein
MAQHEGHGGFRIDEVMNNLDTVDNSHTGANGGFWLSGTGNRPAVYPDVILLHVGSNDVIQQRQINTMGDRLDGLINRITTDRPSAHLIVSSILPMSDPALNAIIKAYDAEIQNKIVPKYEHMGRLVSFVDQYHNFVDSKGNVINARFADGVHPDRIGYNMIGDTWYNAIMGLNLPQPAALSMLQIPEPSVLCLGAIGMWMLLARRPRQVNRRRHLSH